MAETTALKETRFDADAGQRVPLRLEKRGKLFNVAHLFAPLTDDDILEYERNRDLRISEAQAGETDDPQAMAFSSNTFGASLKFWNLHAVGLEGYKLKDGKSVEEVDWKALVDGRDKVFAIENGLLGVNIVPLPEANEDEAYFLDDIDNTSTIQLGAMFNGDWIITKHVLREATAAEISRYKQLTSRTLLVTGTKRGQTDRRIPSRARDLGALYDAMIASLDGYVGRVPLHHKMVVIQHHLNQQQQVNEGN